MYLPHNCKVAPFVKSWKPSDPTSGKVKLLQTEQGKVITNQQHNILTANLLLFEPNQREA